MKNDIDIEYDVVLTNDVTFEPGWHVVLYNDEINSMETVLMALVMIGHSPSKAYEIMIKAHTRGMASAWREPDTKEGKEICIDKENVLRSFSLHVELYLS